MSRRSDAGCLRWVVRYGVPALGFCALALVILLFLVNRWIAPDWHYEELGRVASPDGTLEVVVTRASAGAMTSYRFGAFIVDTDEAFDANDGIIEARGLRVENVSWSDDDELVITLPPGRVTYYESIWPYPPDDSPLKHVRVRLVVDYSLTTAPE